MSPVNTPLAAAARNSRANNSSRSAALRGRPISRTVAAIASTRRSARCSTRAVRAAVAHGSHRLAASEIAPTHAYQNAGLRHSSRRPSSIAAVSGRGMQLARIQPQSLPPAVRELAARLAAAGGRAWLVGGTVRDLLLGAEPRDLDLATDLTPDAIERSMPEVDARDARFGTCVWRGEPDVSITTL